jgi:uncharacterized protein
MHAPKLIHRTIAMAYQVSLWRLRFHIGVCCGNFGLPENKTPLGPIYRPKTHQEATMKSKDLGETNPWSERNWILVLDDGEEAFEAISRFARDNGISGASLTAIGAFKTATLGFFDFVTKRYKEIPIDRQSEVLSAIGDIAIGDDEQASLHMHAVLGFEDGSTKGGHFINGIVHPTLEIIIRENAVGFRRRKRNDIGIALIDV